MGWINWLYLAESIVDDEQKKKPDDKDVAEMLGVTNREVRKTNHQAREDAQNSGYLDERAKNKDNKNKEK